ncbi:MAG: hypothetical protein IIZ07_05445, partial [Ruminococcus sp.]|nr:hypothetical protein [Ruminococcus sp.]
MKKSSEIGRKTGILVAKNSILFVVLGVIAFLAIWAWFTNRPYANADGMSVAAKADGVQVSWSGENGTFYDNLTAKVPSDVVSGKVGMVKFLDGGVYNDYQATPIKLITGDGLNFFEPFLNRRTGTPLLESGTDPNKRWQGRIINNQQSEEKYIDVPLYFRSTRALDLFLANDSLVSPADAQYDENHKNTSAYGGFSKDNIAAASRVGFLNDAADSCNFIWAPNSDAKIVENEDGFTRITETETDFTPGTTQLVTEYQEYTRTTGSGGHWSGVTLSTRKNQNYYLWVPTKQGYASDNFQQQATTMYSNLMTFEVIDQNTGKGLYTKEVTFYLPGRQSPTVIYYINNSSSRWYDTDVNNINMSSSRSTINNNGDSGSPRVEPGDHTYNLEGEGRVATGFYFGNGFENKTVTVKFGYSPDSKQFVIIGYDSSDPVRHYSRYGNQSTETYTEVNTHYEQDTEDVTVTYYPIQNNINVVIANPLTSYALSVSNAAKYSSVIKFMNADKTAITAQSVTMAEQFKIIYVSGEKSEALYKIKSQSNNSFLRADNTSVTYTANEGEATLFNLAYIEGFNGPVVKFGNTYLVISGSTARFIDESILNKNYLMTLFAGSSYDWSTGQAAEVYKYYDGANKTIVSPLNAT